MVSDLAFPGLPAQHRKESEGVCAKVTIRIVQELVLTRQAFEGVLEVGNNAAPLPTLSLRVPYNKLPQEAPKTLLSKKVADVCSKHRSVGRRVWSYHTLRLKTCNTIEAGSPMEEIVLSVFIEAKTVLTICLCTISTSRIHKC